MRMQTHAGTTPAQQYMTHHESFQRVASVIGAALLIGTGGGFVLAAVLTLTAMLGLVTGPWWLALAQARGHLQLYGWAGLLVIGVALHFVPRLRGNPQARPRLVPWIVSALIAELLLRALCQPLATLSNATLWRTGLLASGTLESTAFLGIVSLIALTLTSGLPLALRPAFRGVVPLMLGVFTALGLAGIVNLVNLVQAMSNAGMVIEAGDDLNVALGLLGFLVPMALAMSAQSLPMYAGLDAFPRKALWPLAGSYFAGVALFCLRIPAPSPAASLAGTLLIFIGVFLRLMRRRGRLPKRVSALAPQPQARARSCTARGARQACVVSCIILHR